MPEPAQRAAAVMQADAMRKPGPRERIGLQDVVQELDQFEGARANLPDFVGLFDRVEIVAHMMNATAGWRDDVVVAGEIAHEQRLGVRAFGIETAVGHRLAAAGLVARIVDIMTEPLEQLECRDADLGEKASI